MPVYLILFDLLITIGSVLTFVLIVRWFQVRHRKNKPLLNKLYNTLTWMSLSIFVLFFVSFFIGYGDTFDSLYDMRPITVVLSQNFYGAFFLTYPVLLFMVVRAIYFLWLHIMSPYNLQPNRQGFSAVSMTQQTKDEAERFGQGDNFK